MTETETLTAARVPTVYFIDDSATMREVIKIAFRKENIHVITCADAAAALAQFGEAAPDAVITDVIMPDKDGYEVCDFIKQHDRFGRTPVILMSGVVNKSVAEKAMAVKADELIRKPFQPQDLIVRVKNLLNPKPAGAASPYVAADGPAQHPSQVLSGLFSAQPIARESAASPSSRASLAASPVPPARPSQPPATAAPRPAASVSSAGPEIQKLRNEILRLELLVKKLQAELEAQRQYSAALEAHFKSLQERA
jgi:CheY-like chemotaxis protein